MPKVWEKFNRYSSHTYDDAGKWVEVPSDLKELQPGDTIGVAGSFDEVVIVVKVSATGQITTTSRQEVWNGTVGGHVVKERRYFTNRGEEKGYSDRRGYHFGGVPQLVGTLEVETRRRASRYDAALHALEAFTKKLREARAEGGYGRRKHNAEPITRDEYTEIARLAKACLDDGWGDERPEPLCIECFAQVAAGQKHAQGCSKRPPDPVPEVTAVEVVLDGVCPGCGMKGDSYCPDDCPVMSHPRPHPGTGDATV